LSGFSPAGGVPAKKTTPTEAGVDGCLTFDEATPSPGHAFSVVMMMVQAGSRNLHYNPV
jgi:hypothetical protein